MVIYQIPRLSYGYDELEPFIDAQNHGDSSSENIINHMLMD